jgi:glycosyltransferase involved in cell wall biosynthesis
MKQEMKNPRKKVLFLNHWAWRSGASMLLLNSLRWLKQNCDFDIEVLSNGSGPLINDFQEIVFTKVWRPRGYFLRAVPRRLGSWVRPRLEAIHLRMLLHGSRYDLVYANTAATAQFVALLDGRYEALLWHIHELPYVLQTLPGSFSIRQLFPRASRFVAVSQAVSKTLTQVFKVPEDRVDLIHGFVPLRELPPSDRKKRRQRVLASLGWPEDSFVLGGCGELGWAKGTDLFVQVGRRIAEYDAGGTVRLLWLGGSDREDKETLAFDFDVRALGLRQHCQRVPSTPEVDDYYCAMDAFALTSRADSFPLVMLDAGMHRLPVVCFASSGGAPEYVADDAGMVARYADVNEFAEKVLSLKNSPDLRSRLGESGRRKVETRHTVEVQGPKLLRSIERCLRSRA